MANIIIHRGASQIGGVSTEISTVSAKVFIDFGENLPGVDTPMPEIDGLTIGDGRNRALFLTHYHGDHIGRLEDVLTEVPVYMGKTEKAIYANFAMRVSKGSMEQIERICTFEPLNRIQIGDITVTPLMIDHSAFDAYMFVIEASGKRILHTGDFRLHGVRGGKTLNMLTYYARDIDYIICEGTTVSRKEKPPVSEHELRQKAAELMQEAKYVFVLCASTNIDRVGTFYHANPKGRLFVCDPYQKEQLEAVQLGHADKSSFYDFKRVYSYASNLDAYMKAQGFCMLVRQGAMFRRVMEKYKDNCLVIFSMWEGYLDERARNQGLVDFLAPYNYQVLHTSGHASPGDIKALYETVHPKCGLIPIHTDAPERFYDIVPERKLILLTDGETFVL